MESEGLTQRSLLCDDLVLVTWCALSDLVVLDGDAAGVMEQFQSVFLQRIFIKDYVHQSLQVHVETDEGLMCWLIMIIGLLINCH